LISQSRGLGDVYKRQLHVHRGKVSVNLELPESSSLVLVVVLIGDIVDAIGKVRDYPIRKGITI
jgi:hypothetical protein